MLDIIERRNPRVDGVQNIRNRRCYPKAQEESQRPKIRLSRPPSHRTGIDVHEGWIDADATGGEPLRQFRQYRTGNPRHGKVCRFAEPMLGMDRRAFGVRVGLRRAIAAIDP